MELIEKASNYAEENVINVLKEAFAKVYADGYRDGYKDREEEIPVELRDNKTEFVDLGLPSGTFWSADYEMENGEILYLPYCKTFPYKIPTEEQWKELLDFCKWEFSYINSISRKYDCIGRNGNHISFYSKGYSKMDEGNYYPEKIYFWVKCEDDSSDKSAAYMFYDSGEIRKLVKEFAGYKLPIRLVR